MKGSQKKSLALTKFHTRGQYCEEETAAVYIIPWDDDHIYEIGSILISFSNKKKKGNNDDCSSIMGYLLVHTIMGETSRN